MHITRHFLKGLSAALIVVVTVSPSLGAPTVVSELGSYPLLGSNKSLTELQISIATNEDRIAKAAKLVGMTTSEYHAFRVATQTQRPQWGIVPMRLDAMTWYSYGQVRVIRNVEIPRASYGFEYDETTPTERLRIFLPIACGNLSIVRERIMRAAAVKPPVRVSAVSPYISAPLAAVAKVAAPIEAPPPMPAASPTPLPTIYLGSRPARGLFPFIGAMLGILTAGRGGTGGHGHGVGVGGGGGCGCTINP